MQGVQIIESSASGGLRARKRAKILARIQGEAMRLFVERGFEATTLDDIAAAAEVSRRSLFAYFESKEEIVFSHKGDFPRLVREAVGRRPADETLLDMAEHALADVGASYVTAQTRDLARLICDTPALRARDQAKYELVERALAKALSDRKGLAETDVACRVTAAAAIGIMKLAFEGWLESGEVDPGGHFKEAFEALRRIAG